MINLHNSDSVITAQEPQDPGDEVVKTHVVQKSHKRCGVAIFLPQLFSECHITTITDFIGNQVLMAYSLTMVIQIVFTNNTSKGQFLSLTNETDAATSLSGSLPKKLIFSYSAAC